MAVTGNTPALSHDNKHDNDGRFDLYARIHKALRAFMTDTLGRAGRTDIHDEADVRGMLAQVRELLAACEQHVEKENNYVHVAIEARAPGAASRIAHEHLEHGAEIRNLRAMADHLPSVPSTLRSDYLHGLYRHLSLFIAENFAHMNVEETEHNRVLWTHYTDAELQEVEGRILASLPPETVAMIARWMLPNVNHAERTMILAGMRENAPPEAFAGMVEICRVLLPMPEWMKLARALGVPSTPELAQAA